MKGENLEPCSGFHPDEQVCLRTSSGEKITQLKVHSSGNRFIDFKVSSDSPLLDQLKLSNQVQIHLTEGNESINGSLKYLNYKPTFYEESLNASADQSSNSTKLLRFSPLEETNTKYYLGRLSDWLSMLSISSLPATIVPILFGVTYALWMDWPLSLWASIMAIFGGASLHCASNLHNELSEYRRALEESGRLVNNAINEFRFQPWLVWFTALFLYAMSLVGGFVLVYWRGTELLFIGLLAYLFASFYSLLRNYSSNFSVIQDIALFILTGPLMAVAASISATGQWDWKLCLASIPVACFVTLLLHQNDLLTIPIDRRAGATTLAIVLGFKGSKIYYHSLIFAGYGVIGILAPLGVIPVWSLLTFLTLPLAFYNLKILREVKSPTNPKLPALRFSTVALEVIFGLTYVLGFITETLL